RTVSTVECPHQTAAEQGMRKTDGGVQNAIACRHLHSGAAQFNTSQYNPAARRKFRAGIAGRKGNEQKEAKETKEEGGPALCYRELVPPYGYGDLGWALSCQFSV